jgi:hypothetical protein
VFDAAIAAELCLQAQALERSHLGVGIGGVAMALHQGQELIIQLAGAPEAIRLEEGRRHRAGGGKTHPAALAGSAVVLAQVRNGQLNQTAMSGFRLSCAVNGLGRR